MMSFHDFSLLFLRAFSFLSSVSCHAPRPSPATIFGGKLRRDRYTRATSATLEWSKIKQEMCPHHLTSTFHSVVCKSPSYYFSFFSFCTRRHRHRLSSFVVVVVVASTCRLIIFSCKYFTMDGRVNAPAFSVLIKRVTQRHRQCPTLKILRYHVDVVVISHKIITTTVCSLVLYV